MQPPFWTEHLQCGPNPFQRCENPAKTPPQGLAPVFGIKAGFDNVDNATFARILREGGIPQYLVSWVSSFLGERSCTLVFQ